MVTDKCCVFSCRYSNLPPSLYWQLQRTLSTMRSLAHVWRTWPSISNPWATPEVPAILHSFIHNKWAYAFFFFLSDLAYTSTNAWKYHNRIVIALQKGKQTFSIFLIWLISYLIWVHLFIFIYLLLFRLVTIFCVYHS